VGGVHDLKALKKRAKTTCSCSSRSARKAEELQATESECLETFALEWKRNVVIERFNVQNGKNKLALAQHRAIYERGLTAEKRY
jgi:hypothetical protein